ncbi:metallophosphoesterase [Lewinella sp. 4G2]|uniref:metallophosphoesterase n=1 Tax=Lewinella sp. 4G2 TaxID=1803372 RepID=UPI0007B4642D|nr:metallophosphoesterase [Lewinella sp. 4G2]OAV42833.1 phosphoesterase [Lewinella sp. 4G2]
MAIYFTADTHFGHANILKYTDRPYANAQEMDEALIQNWNDTVGPDDTVYHLGDFSLTSPAKTRKIIARLNGTIHLISGNHESSAHACADQFAWVKDYYELSVPDPDAHRGQRHYVLFHYAMRVWNGSHHGTFHLYGHSHGTLPDLPTERSIDVGVDCFSGHPVSLEKVREILLAKPWVSPFAS